MSEHGRNLVWQCTSDSVERTMAIGRAIGAAARAGDVLALVGELGAGKTQLVRGIATGMGIDPVAVSSPTFVMVHEYPVTATNLVLVHIDGYRLQSLEDLESIGWVDWGDELRRGAVVAVEWADRLGATLGADVLRVELSHVGEGQRGIEIRPSGAWIERFDTLCAALAKIA